MEKKVEKAITSFNPKSETTFDHNPQPNPIVKKPKRSRNFFKAVLFLMRGGSRKSKKAVFPVDDESKSIWRKVVGSMRPMHLQSNQSPPQIEQKNIDVQGEDEFGYGSESQSAPSLACSRYGSTTSSRYASAEGLNEMVEESKEEELANKDNINDDGDDMIDAKAEEFISQFYQSMRLQRMDVVDHRYNEISMRSLGL